MGLRQMLPVQTKRMVFIPDSTRFKLGAGHQNVKGEISLAQNQTSFGIAKNPPRARPQRFKLERADLHPDQSQRRMSNRRGHPAHLTVFAFDQFEGNPAVGNILAETYGGLAWWHFRGWIQQ